MTNASRLMTRPPKRSTPRLGTWHKQLAQLAARKAAKKAAEAAAYATLKPKHRDHVPAPAPPTKTPEQLRERVRAALLRRPA
jgi:aryl-alcohol dehydrogenase-like predicted oxidoreductase